MSQIANMLLNVETTALGAGWLRAPNVCNRLIRYKACPTDGLEIRGSSAAPK
jgi:hypothetical protein